MIHNLLYAFPPFCAYISFARLFLCRPFTNRCVILVQEEASGDVCVPVLSRRPCGAALPQETVRYLRRLKICEASLLWREDVDLMKLHRAQRLSLTLLREGLLPR